MNSLAIEWMSSLGAVLFAAAALALIWRIRVNLRDGVRWLALRNQLAAGAVLWSAGDMIGDGVRWWVADRLGAGLAWRAAAAGTADLVLLAGALRIAGVLLFVRAVTKEQCGEKIWRGALAVAVACEIVFGILR